MNFKNLESENSVPEKIKKPVKNQEKSQAIFVYAIISTYEWKM